VGAAQCGDGLRYQDGSRAGEPAEPDRPRAGAAGTVPPEQIKSVEQVAATSVLRAVSPLLAGITGRYFVDCNDTEVVYRRTGTWHGVARNALDPANAEHLWTLSDKLVAGAG
jgi:hypothetical protein